MSASGAVMWRGQYVLKQDGMRPWLEDADATDDQGDDGEHTRLGLVTAWIKLSGLLGYQRVRSIMVLGRFQDDAVIALGFDGEGEFLEYPVSGDGNEEEVEIHVPRQKCRMVRVGVSGAAEVTRIRLEVGVKKGSYKRAARSL